MKKAKKWMLVLGGVAAFLACAVECSANPFPGIKKGYQVGFYNGGLVVSFHSTPLYGNEVLDGVTVRRPSLLFWAVVDGSKESREVLCAYRGGEILDGTGMICHVFDLDEAGGYTITISARVRSRWNSRGEDSIRDDTFRSPLLLVPSSPEISEREVGLENDGEPLADADADADGVADDIDECADTPEDAEVNERGCVPSSTTAAVVPQPGVVPPGALAPVDLAGAIRANVDEGCTLVGAAAFNPALFILLCAALLPIMRSRRK